MMPPFSYASPPLTAIEGDVLPHADGCRRRHGAPCAASATKPMISAAADDIDVHAAATIAAGSMRRRRHALLLMMI